MAEKEVRAKITQSHANPVNKKLQNEIGRITASGYMTSAPVSKTRQNKILQKRAQIIKHKYVTCRFMG